ncbi:DUF3450 domain-containing protein [Halopseudomonas pelagia]|uniref:DUF3450 domain-containing protein n=1 Tax=Halopseudomonas pelagia TaxID=553151 RepID=UPI0003A16F71|nr:DUF3450 domain-containing protein [Halopseudomonas pelagia]
MRAVLILLAVMLPAAVSAQDVTERALGESEALMRDAQGSQQRIEQLDDATREALLRYRQAMQQREQLSEYNSRLTAMVAAQQAELQSLEGQLSSIEDTQHELLPLMQRMLDSLEQFVALDLPFLPEERGERIDQLRDLMLRADVSIAEKYRRLIEAYQIESDYGRTLEAWRGSLEKADSVRVVDYLRLGRVSFFYQSLDGREQGVWDTETQSWTALPNAYRRTLEQGMRMARQQQTPMMLRLPLPPITEQQRQQEGQP